MVSKRVLHIADMSPRQLEGHERILHAISLMRRLQMPISAAAREAGTTVETILRLGAPAFRRREGRWVVTPHDPLERRMLFYDRKGSYYVVVGSSTTATRISDYHNAIRRFLETGDFSHLRKFAGKYVVDVDGKRHSFLTDRNAIRGLARAGQFGFESIY